MIALDDKEYVRSAWLPMSQILAGSYHPCLKQSVLDLRAKWALETLVEAVQTNGRVPASSSADHGAAAGTGEAAGNEAILSSAKEFVAHVKRAQPTAQALAISFEGAEDGSGGTYTAVAKGDGGGQAAAKRQKTHDGPKATAVAPTAAETKAAEGT